MKQNINYMMYLVLLLFCFTNGMKAQNSNNANDPLSTKEQSIVAISAFTAKGNIPQLKTALQDGLNAGLSINEIKEMMLQLYAYTGFPRSLNGLNVLIAVLKERKQTGIIDSIGKEASPFPAAAKKNKRKFGTAIQTKLVGQPVKGEVYEFAPVIDAFLKEHLFGDIFGRDNLDFKTREIVTIAALAGIGGAENQLRSHFNVGMYNGLTEPQLIQLVSVIQNKIGATEGNAANEVLQNILGKKITTPINTSSTPKTDFIFATGEKITNNNFIGAAYLQPLIAADSLNPTSIGNVTFEPGARTNWHYHPGGQILLAISGTGYYQEKGQPKRILRKGDVVKCPPNIEHWHGASPHEEFVQVAITNTQQGQTVWLIPVTDKEYKATPGR